jgi:hypothetical protein
MSGAARNGLCTTAKYLICAVGVGFVTAVKYQRHTASAAAGNGMAKTINYLQGRTSGDAGDGWALRLST